jgi:hypothetical protein
MSGVTRVPASGVRSGAEGPEAHYAIIIDEEYDAVLLHDLLRQAAQEHHTRAMKATLRRAVNGNMHKHEVFAKYAERCEYIRKQAAERIAAKFR